MMNKYIESKPDMEFGDSMTQAALFGKVADDERFGLTRLHRHSLFGLNFSFHHMNPLPLSNTNKLALPSFR